MVKWVITFGHSNGLITRFEGIGFVPVLYIIKLFFRGNLVGDITPKILSVTNYPETDHISEASILIQVNLSKIDTKQNYTDQTIHKPEQL